MKHLTESGLALYAAGDLPLWQRGVARLHVARCHDCQARVALYRSDRARRLETAERMPEGIDWETLAAEMAANIRVGLAAGECVAEAGARTRASWGWARGWGLGWRPAAAVTGVVVVLTG